MTRHSCPSFPCPICYPSLQWPPHYPPAYPHYGYGTPVQHGCVCPAGAEKTCQGPLCPRKPTIAGGVFGPVTAQAGEAGTATTPQSGVVHEHAVPEGNAP